MPLTDDEEELEEDEEEELDDEEDDFHTAAVLDAGGGGKPTPCDCDDDDDDGDSYHTFSTNGIITSPAMRAAIRSSRTKRRNGVFDADDAFVCDNRAYRG